MKAYALINVNVGRIADVIYHLNTLDCVQNSDMTFGEYDIISIIQTDTIESLAKIISNEVQTIPGITRTVTCMAIDITKRDN